MIYEFIKYSIMSSLIGHQNICLELTHQSLNCHKGQAYHKLDKSKLASSHSFVKTGKHQSIENGNKLLDDRVLSSSFSPGGTSEILSGK